MDSSQPEFLGRKFPHYELQKVIPYQWIVSLITIRIIRFMVNYNKKQTEASFFFFLKTSDYLKKLENILEDANGPECSRVSNFYFRICGVMAEPQVSPANMSTSECCP